MFENITKLTLMSSESCNLQCSYCLINKNKNKDIHQRETEKVKHALESGEYISKYLYIFKKYNIDPTKIHELELWGQEPTLTLDKFILLFDRIQDWLINCESIFFSTNGVTFPERIIDLINTINLYFKRKHKRKFEVRIQFSFDGLNENEDLRGIKANVVINNIKTIINEINNMKILQNLHLVFYLHGVITINHIQHYINSNYNYWSDIDDVVSELLQVNKNKLLLIKMFTSFIENPYNATVEDGQLLAQYAKQCINNLNKDYSVNWGSPISPFMTFYRGITDLFNKTQKDMEFDKNILNRIINNYNLDFNDNIINDSSIGLLYGCGPGQYDIKMRYDGTLIYCQNMIFGLTEEDLEDKQGIEYDILRIQLHNPSFQPNLLTATKELVLNFIDVFDVSSNYTFSFVISNIINTMYLLLQNHLIDDSYTDNPDKILRHALYIALSIQCFYNNVILTGSLYNVFMGTIRLYCNGVLDIIEEYTKEWGNIIAWR